MDYDAAAKDVADYLLAEGLKNGQRWVFDQPTLVDILRKHDGPPAAEVVEEEEGGRAASSDS